MRESDPSGGLLRYATVEGMDARDIRIHNFPPGSNAAPSQDDLLVIRRNHKLAPCHSTRCAGYHSLLVRGPEHEAPRSLTPLYPPCQSAHVGLGSIATRPYAAGVVSGPK